MWQGQWGSNSSDGHVGKPNCLRLVWAYHPYTNLTKMTMAYIEVWAKLQFATCGFNVCNVHGCSVPWISPWWSPHAGWWHNEKTSHTKEAVWKHGHAAVRKERGERVCPSSPLPKEAVDGMGLGASPSANLSMGPSMSSNVLRFCTTLQHGLFAFSIIIRISFTYCAQQK